MAKKKTTVFQALDRAISGNWGGQDSVTPHINSYDMSGGNGSKIIYKTTNKDDYEQKKLELQQDKYLKDRWYKANVNLSVTAYSGLNNVKLMYRDADLMDAFPEIGAALDIVSEESCITNSDNNVINVYSKSDRIKNILEDLFVNRLNVQLTAPMIIRAMAKYGNQFMLLDVDHKNGVKGWRQLPVFNMERIENGIQNPYGAGMSIAVNGINKDDRDMSTQFIWLDDNNSQVPFRDWQIAHFRLLTNSLYLPYGVSYLNSARRHWRMLSLMEDMMLIYRLERSIERRVYKIFVGAIDDADVPAYIEQIANLFKRTPIIDPMTGQVDLRKNFLDVSSDYFIPVRREDAPNPIETLQAANSQVQMEEIEYMQNKIFAALRVPKTFLNFQEAQGKGQNLSFMDVRFSRMITRVQQFLLMELNKIAMIHLYLMGLSDEIGNFQLTLNTPSTTIEAQELDDLNKRLSALQLALTDPGIGMPMMSMHKALRDIMKMNDREILDMFNEIRLEKAMAAELQATANIIKHTGLFDITDRIYGDFESINNGGAQQQQQGQGEDEMGGGGGGAIGGGLGGDDMGMDLGEPGADELGDLGGETGETDLGGAPNADEGAPMESRKITKPLINEYKNQKIKSFTKKYMDYLSEQNHVKSKGHKSFTDIYLNMLNEGQKIEDGETEDPFDFELKSSTLQEKVKSILENLDTLVDEDEVERETLIEEVIKELPDFSGDTNNN